MSIPFPEKRISQFETMAFGMFVHWGLYSIRGQGEWIQCLKKIPKEEYIKLKDNFTARDFDPEKWAKTAKKAGMKYITLTTRHHEGFSLYDTKGLNTFDAPHSPCGRDLISEFTQVCRKEDIVPFFYHTTLDWYNEDFENDFENYLEYLRKSVEILCTNYGKIGGLWFDGNWSRNDDWKLDELYGTIRKYQPEAIIINNSGMGERGKLVHHEIDSVTFEQGLPLPFDRDGMDKYVTSETCFTMNDHWGFANSDLNYKSPGELIENLCHCRRVGSNLLLNVGPDKEGNIPLMQTALLSCLGEWIDTYADAVYNGRPCGIAGEGKNFGLKTADGRLYLFVHNLPIEGSADVTVGGSRNMTATFTGVLDKIKEVRWMDDGKSLSFAQNIQSGLFSFNTTGFDYGSNRVVRVAELIV